MPRVEAIARLIAMTQVMVDDCLHGIGDAERRRLVERAVSRLLERPKASSRTKRRRGRRTRIADDD